MSHLESNSERSFHTNTSSLIQPAVVPKYFNVPFAIHHGYFRCVRYLLELSHDSNERDNQLHTPLILCAYIENDRWSLSLAQNLIEKEAKIALADNARRNAMHHACALQRIHLVQLYLSCLEFDIEAKDCDGNTYLHYAAITGNCEIAELLMRIADKMNVRLDQCVNREGCSAAVLALRYGHIECANQITHRNWDEFFVVPRPLSVYESPPINDQNHNRITTFTPTKQMSKTSQTNKMNKRPSSLSFGLLKILFNDSDAPYSTHLAKLCNQGKQNHHRQARQKNPELSCTLKKREQNKSNVTNGTQHSSVETVITDTNPRKKRQERKSSADAKEKVSPDKTGLPPRRPSSVHQHRNSRDTQFSIERVKHPMNAPIIHIQDFDASASRSQSITIIPVPKPSQVNVNTERPKTPLLTRHKTSNDISDVQYPVYTKKIPPTSIHKKMKKKSTTNNRPKSAAFTFKPQYSNMTFESSTYSKTLYTGRPLSAVLQNHHCRSPVQHIVDPSCSIREVTGVAAASRYNNPVELFGIKPEELFGSPDNTSKSITHHDTQLKRSNTQQQYMYQQEIDKFADLYAIQHTFSYRPSVKPPVKPRGNISDLKSNDKNRKTSISKNSMNSSRASTTLKPSTLAILNINRRFSEYRRPTVKTVHT